MTTTLASPRKTTAKYSKEEKERATLAKGGEATVMITALRNPPMAEHMIAMPRRLGDKSLLVETVTLPGGGNIHRIPGDVEKNPGDGTPENAPAIDGGHEQKGRHNPHQIGEGENQHNGVEHGDARKGPGQDADRQTERESWKN